MCEILGDFGILREMTKIMVRCSWIVGSAQEPCILEKTAREFPKATLPNPKPFKTEKKAREFPKATQPHINIYIYYRKLKISLLPQLEEFVQ